MVITIQQEQATRMRTGRGRINNGDLAELEGISSVGSIAELMNSGYEIRLKAVQDMTYKEIHACQRRTEPVMNQAY
jgi:hypothetical protein